MLYYFLFLLVCYSLILLIIHIKHPFSFREMFFPDSYDEDFIFPHVMTLLASPVCLAWIIYDEFIKKED